MPQEGSYWNVLVAILTAQDGSRWLKLGSHFGSSWAQTDRETPLGKQRTNAGRALWQTEITGGLCGIKPNMGTWVLWGSWTRTLWEPILDGQIWQSRFFLLWEGLVGPGPCGTWALWDLELVGGWTWTLWDLGLVGLVACGEVDPDLVIPSPCDTNLLVHPHLLVIPGPCDTNLFVPPRTSL